MSIKRNNRGDHMVEMFITESGREVEKVSFSKFDESLDMEVEICVHWTRVIEFMRKSSCSALYIYWTDGSKSFAKRERCPFKGTLEISHADRIILREVKN